MKIIKGLFSFLWRVWFVIVATLATLSIGVFLILPFSFRAEDYSKAYKFLRVWAKMVFYLSGLRLRKHNFVELSSYHPYILIANHTSMMDIMLMLIISKEPIVFIGKKELEKLPVFGYIYKRLMITVDRNNPHSRRQVYRQSLAKLNSKKSICIFPEGGVPDESVTLDEFKNGAFMMAIQQKVPIVITTIVGLKKILPYAYFSGGPGTVHVYLNDIVDTSTLSKKDSKGLKESSYDMIYQQLQKSNQI